MIPFLLDIAMDIVIVMAIVVTLAFEGVCCHLPQSLLDSIVWRKLDNFISDTRNESVDGYIAPTLYGRYLFKEME